MRNPTLSLLLILVSLCVMSLIIILFMPAQSVKAQQEPILITPYYGNEVITSRFDHYYPTYTGYPDNNNNIFIRHDGARWDPPTPVELNNCTTGVNCYDGHNGYDFALSYERVLAAASGTVTSVGWQDTNNRNAGYGFRIEITHSNGYITRYGHLSVIAVSQGYYVTAGQIIGTSGNTGNSTNPHLHFDVRRSDNSRNVDPFGWTGGAGQDPWANHANGATSWFMWSDGEWAGSPIPDPTPSGSPEIVVDDNTNNSNGFSKGRGGPFNNICPPAACPYWYRQTVGYGSDSYYTYISDTTDYWAKWQPTITKPGIYEVWVYIPSANATSWQTKYTIVSDAGERVAFGIDQEGLYNQWVCLGAYHFLSSSSNYYIYVTDVTDESESLSRKIGVDAVKFIQRPTYPFYTPDIKTTDSWSPTVSIRNNSGNEALVNSWDLKVDGSLYCGTSSTLSAHTIRVESACAPLSVSKVIDANQDISVIAINDNGIVSEGYSGIPATLTVSGIGTANTVYVPAYCCDYYDWDTSLYVQNTGTAQTTVTAQFYKKDNGDPGPSATATINPNGQAVLTPACSAGEPIGSVKVTANQPLAVISRYDNSSYDMSFSEEGISSGGSKGYAPSLLKSYYGWWSSYQVQEVNGQSATVSVTYYDKYGNVYTNYTSFTLLARGFKEVYMGSLGLTDGRSYSAVISVTGGSGKIVTAIHHTNTNVMEALGYHGFKAGARDLSLPYLKKNVDGWNASLIIQNVGSANAQVTVYFYESDGDYSTYLLSGLQPGRAAELYNEIPYGFYGSVQIHSEGADIVAAIHQAHDDGRHFGYSAP